MSRMDFLHQGGTPFDGFLYADVGQDRGGNTVSVLSALARLGVDPWDEAADLSDLPRDGAQTRLDALLARFTDVPALGQDKSALIPRLVDLLPTSSGRTTGQRVTQSARITTAGFGPVLAVVAVLLVILLLAKTFILGAFGTGD